jgi:hypothetical protein
VAAVHEACVVLAHVGVPAHGGIRRDDPQATRKRVPCGGPRPAQPWLAPLEHQLQRGGVIVRELAADVVRHVPHQLVLEVAAREA